MNREPEREGVFIRAGAWLEDEWPQALQYLGQTGMAVSAIFLGFRQDSSFTDWRFSWPGIILWVSIIASGVGIGFGRKKSRRLSAVESELASVRNELDAAQEANFNLRSYFVALIDEQLVKISNDVLGLGDSERVSVYKHVEGKFLHLARYSKNPVFNRPGRIAYYENQGCVGQAWEQGESFEEGLPDFRTDAASYLQELQSKWNVPILVGENLKMKSRRIAAFALENEQRHRMAVIVFESIRTDVLDFDRLRETIDGPEGRWLRSVVYRAQPIMQSPEDATKEGF